MPRQSQLRHRISFSSLNASGLLTVILLPGLVISTLQTASLWPHFIVFGWNPQSSGISDNGCILISFGISKLFGIKLNSIFDGISGQGITGTSIFIFSGGFTWISNF